MVVGPSEPKPATPPSAREEDGSAKVSQFYRYDIATSLPDHIQGSLRLAEAPWRVELSKGW